MIMMKVLQLRLRELFDYREDGELIRKSTGELAGGKPIPVGYRRVSVDGQYLYLHQAVFIWHMGFLPKMIDHDDRDKGNNRFSNLIPSNPQHNQNNRGPSRKSKTLVKGVFQEGQRGSKHSAR